MVMTFSNGKIAEYIDVMHRDEVVARIDFVKGKFKRTNYLVGTDLEVLLKNPLLSKVYDKSGKVKDFLRSRLSAGEGVNGGSSYQEWVVTPLDKLFVTNGRDIDDKTWLRFMPVQENITFNDVSYF